MKYLAVAMLLVDALVGPFLVAVVWLTWKFAENRVTASWASVEDMGKKTLKAYTPPTNAGGANGTNRSTSAGEPARQAAGPAQPPSTVPVTSPPTVVPLTENDSKPARLTPSSSPPVPAVTVASEATQAPQDDGSPSGLDKARKAGAEYIQGARDALRGFANGAQNFTLDKWQNLTEGAKDFTQEKLEQIEDYVSDSPILKSFSATQMFLIELVNFLKKVSIAILIFAAIRLTKFPQLFLAIHLLRSDPKPEELLSIMTK